MWVAGLYYFVVLCGAGLVLECARLLWLDPALGGTWVEASEAAVFLAIAAVAAHVLARSEALSRSRAAGMGFIAVALVLAQDFILVAPLLDMGAREYVLSRDAGGRLAYYGALAIAAALPVLVPGAARAAA